jgi:hypothetical protein
LHKYVPLFFSLSLSSLTGSGADLFEPFDDFAGRAVHLFAYATLRVRTESAELFAQVAVYDRFDWEVRGAEGAVFVAQDWRRFDAQVHFEVGAEIGFVFARERDKRAERAAEGGVDDDFRTAGL